MISYQELHYMREVTKRIVKCSDPAQENTKVGKKVVNDINQLLRKSRGSHSVRK